MPESVYASMLRTRANVLAAVRAAPKYLDEKYAKNHSIAEGRDARGQSEEGLYSGALEISGRALFGAENEAGGSANAFPGRRAKNVNSVRSLRPPASP